MEKEVAEMTGWPTVTVTGFSWGKDLPVTWENVEAVWIVRRMDRVRLSPGRPALLSTGLECLSVAAAYRTSTVTLTLVGGWADHEALEAQEARLFAEESNAVDWAAWLLYLVDGAEVGEPVRIAEDGGEWQP